MNFQQEQQLYLLQEQVCREACSLNNTAIALMQRGDFEGSLRTLKDAIAHMEQVSPSSSPSSSFSSSSKTVSNQGHKHMRMADARLCQSMTMMNSASASSLCNHMAVVESNDTVALHTMANTIASMAASASSSHSAMAMTPTAIVIREPRPLKTINGTMTFDRETGMLLYNFALSAFFTAHYTTRRQEKKSKLLDVAYRSLIMAHSTFSHLLEQQEEQLSFSSTSSSVDNDCNGSQDSFDNNKTHHHNDITPEDEIACLEQVILLHFVQILALSAITQLLQGQGQVQHAAQAMGSIQALAGSMRMHHHVMTQVFCDPRLTAAAA